ncbi:hypothetical protein [Puniceicoccus vermicola]|uniref:Glycoside hydrolase n=1 Tax=Puniceicoccus vermicola TaxID=388746 RepID=A0A7X1B3Z2_9BACT|nr:hypothetical protein [Puniceicoccus vermicola]MBC2603975.1 hypothetical protein [Puniceicoccus vermicola]
MNVLNEMSYIKFGFFRNSRMVFHATVGIALLVLASVDPAYGGSGEEVNNLLLDKQSWAKFHVKEKVEFDWSSRDLLQVAAPEEGRIVYQNRIPLVDSRITATFDFIEHEPEDNTSAGVIFHGVDDESGEPLRAEVYPQRELFVFGDTSETFKRLPENPLHYELDIVFEGEQAVLYWGGREISRAGVQINQANSSVCVFVSQGSIQVSKVLVRQRSDANTILFREGADVSIDVGDSLKSIPSPWTDYWGTHYAYVEGPEDADPHTRYSAVRSYGGPHIGIVREEKRSDATIRPAVFDDEEVRVDIDSFRRESNDGMQFVSELIPELIDYDLMAVWQMHMRGERDGQLFFERDVYYHFLSLMYQQWPQVRDHVVWQVGNELVSLHWNPKLVNRKKFRNMRPPEGLPGNQFNKGYDLNWKLDFYINHWLAPAVQVVERVSNERFGGPNAIPVAVGSMNPYNAPNVWFLESLMESSFGDDAPAELRGDPVWKHFDYLTVHYMFVPNSGSEIRDRMDRYYEDYLKTGKVKGIWITELHGRAGKGPVTILASGFKFLDWVVDNQLTADQAKVFWWGERERAGGDGMDLTRKMGEFFGQSALKYDHLDSDKADVYVVFEDSLVSTRALVCVIPNEVKGFVDFGSIRLNGLGFEGWNVEAVQYSKITLPMASELSPEVSEGALILPLNRRITEPFLIWLKK